MADSGRSERRARFGGANVRFRPKAVKGMIAVGKQHTNDEILVALAQARYFDSPPSMQDVFRTVVEDDLSISLERAIQQICQSGLARFTYSNDLSLHPYDQVDTWEVTLTEAGRDALKRLGFQ